TAPEKSCPRESRCAAPESDVPRESCLCRRTLPSARHHLRQSSRQVFRAPPVPHLSCLLESRPLYLFHFRRARRCMPSCGPSPPPLTSSSLSRSAAPAE